MNEPTITQITLLPRERMPPSIQADALTARIRQARRRIHLLLSLRYGSLGLLIGVSGAGLLLGLSQMRFVQRPSLLFLCALWIIGITMGVAFAFRRQWRDVDIARLVERRADLQERLSSAVEFRQQIAGCDTSFYAAQQADANRCAAQLDVVALLPIRFPRTLPTGGLLLVLLCFAYAASATRPIDVPRSHAALNMAAQDLSAIKAAAAAIEQVSAQMEKRAAQQHLTRAKQAASEANALAAQMKRGELDKRQALVALHKLTQKLEKEEETRRPAPLQNPFASAAPNFLSSSSPMQQDTPRLQPASQSGANGKPQDGRKSFGNRSLTSQTAPQQTERTAQAFRQDMKTAEKTDPNTLNALRDERALQELTQSLQAASRPLAMDSQPDAGGRQPGQGIGGKSIPMRPLPDPAATPRLLSPKPDGISSLIRSPAVTQSFAAAKMRSSGASENTLTALARNIRAPQGSDSQFSTSGALTTARRHSRYYQLYKSSRKQAESALDKEPIPAAYRQQVRDYFDRMQP